ncbi:MAG: MFS transporter [Betaproteobacteria bacterium]|nr:MFS transporter [Betaproteobacteria bacterium]
MSAAPKLFRGWVVVAATFVALFVIFGIAYSFSAFFFSLQQQFGAARGDVSLIFSLCGFLYFTIGALTGTLADRIGPRWLIVAGFMFLAAGLLGASRAASLPELYATYSIGVGLGIGCVYVPAVSAVQPWFIRRRGLASGLASSGIGVGTLLVPLLAVGIIEHYGWRGTFELFAWLAIVLGIATGFLIDNSPARHGLQPDGVNRRAEVALKSAAARPTGVAMRAAMRSPAFWLMYTGIAAFSTGLFIPFVHLAPYARDHGMSEQTGVLLMGLIGVGSVVGRFSLAGFGDRFGRRGLLAGVYAMSAAMFVLWAVSANAPALAVFALVFGTCYGVFVAVLPPLAMDFFGARNLAGIIGALYTGAGVGTLIGPAVAGFAFDLAGSYLLPILASSLLMLLALGCALALRREADFVAAEYRQPPAVLSS